PDTDYLVGIAQQIPVQDQSYDLVVSALAFNFFDDLAAALEEMKRVLKPEGTIAAYVWDYAGEMEFLRIFWDTVVELDPAAAPLDEGNRFPICNPTRLEEAFHAAALHQIQSGYLVMTTRFMHFDDYWNPFLGGQGPAPSYLGSLSPVQQTRLREAIREKLPVESDGSIQLIARAIAIRGNL
ncbi:MAG: methyltransferase domain-containing protein, partial [Saprospiraceae bacterium]|nr:methyltransferase domain-containing protein [Saprospiraceae bacterium]